ncbi:hypothetical protein [Natronocalculus amylovorans]|uniref:HVO-A0261-like N-terminal domain-containing protein n=1 Tax=Natronocalculus amylovorans TaxID=2917812 RepID=A0AAE3FWC5_9EURY|nr:hypothetical protein [Natronocalculus amylovorans]MCL9816110.1 hypothetical protein [Natronocalculus amylovorans]
MNSAHGAVALLANSENRVAVLEVLQQGPIDRAAIQAETAVSSATLRRILTDFEARYWIVPQGDTCELTPLGAWAVEEFTNFLNMMQTCCELQQISNGCPETSCRSTFDV